MSAPKGSAQAGLADIVTLGAPLVGQQLAGCKIARIALGRRQ